MAPGFLRIGALALRASNICPSNPTCPSDDSCSFTATNGASLVVSCATDFYGGDLQLAQTPTLAGCMSACAATTGCLAASYVGQNCYLKSTVTNGVANANVIGVSVTSRPVDRPVVSQLTCPSSYSCPENDGCTFVGADQRPFKLSCGVDFYGGDLSSVWTDSYQSCTTACASNPDCIAASFTGGTRDGPCYLKKQNNGATFNSNVDGVFFDKTVQSSSSLPSVSSTTSSASSTISSHSSTTSATVVATFATDSSIVSRSSTIATTVVVSSSASLTATSSPVIGPSTFGCPAPAPTASILPTNFCLKVVTPGIASTGYVLRRSDDHVLIIRKPSEKQFQTAFFNLQSTGRLVTTYGNWLAATFGYEVTQVQALGTKDDVSEIAVAELRCDVGAGNILQCVACDATFSRTVFRTKSPAGDFGNDILRIDAQPKRTGYFNLELGIFTGADCP